MNPKEKAAPRRTANTQIKDKEKIRYSKSQAVKFLERMADDAARAKYPDTPPQWLAPRRYRDDTANGLTKCIIDFLRFKGHQAERINSTGRPIDRTKTFTDVLGNRRTIGGVTWISGSGTNGTADISATIAGRSVKIEIKVLRDRQSEAQRRYQVSVEQAGGIYVIARTFEDFYQWYLKTFAV